MKAVGKDEKNKKQVDNKMGEGDSKLKENVKKTSSSRILERM